MNRIVFCLAFFVPVVSLAGQSEQDELTGILHKAVGKGPAYLEIDGSGFISRIVVTGDKLKTIPDKSRIWVTGRIKTGLYGAPDESKQEDQAAPTQWFIVFHVEKCVRIEKPFQRSRDEALQNKQVEATRYPKIDSNEATVGIRYHEFVLLKCDGNVVALHVMPDPRFGWDGINYRWYHLPNGSDKFFLPSPAKADASPNRHVEAGSGDTDEGNSGRGVIEVGPITVGWSKGGVDSGWLYLSDVRDNVLVYSRQFRRLEDFSGKLDAEKWKPLKEIEESNGPEPPDALEPTRSARQSRANSRHDDPKRS